MFALDFTHPNRRSSCRKLTACVPPRRWSIYHMWRPVTRGTSQKPGRRERGSVGPRSHQTGRASHRAWRPHRSAPIRVVEIRWRVESARRWISGWRSSPCEHRGWRRPTTSAPERRRSSRAESPSPEPRRSFNSRARRRTRPISRLTSSSVSEKRGKTVRETTARLT